MEKQDKEKNFCFWLVFLFFLLSRLIKITFLPIFNDEAIYLDWGQRMLHFPGHAFYSLYDGKQPFLMWIFALVNEFIGDPLLAGRLVSVMFGGLTIWGLFKLSKGLIAPLIYIITPLFLFFDRQALMESAVGSVGIWLLYFLMRFSKNQRYRLTLALGGLLGLGLFIKSTSLIFLLLVVVYFFFFGTVKGQLKLWLSLLIFFFTAGLMLLPLLLQPQAKNIIKMGNRYNLTLFELSSIPIEKWWENLKATQEIIFWQLTPPVNFFALIGLILVIKSILKKNSFVLSNSLSLIPNGKVLFLFWLVGSLLIAVLTARNLNPRYLMPLILPLVLFADIGIRYLFQIKRMVGFLILSFLVFPLYLSFLLVFKPLVYFEKLNYLTPNFSQKYEYVTGNPSGYGLAQLRQFLEEKAQSGPIYVGIRLDAGNPENALMAYYFKDPKIKVIYFDKQIINPEVSIDKIIFERPFYFISRSEHKGGLENYLIEEKRFYKPENKSYFGVYTLNN